MNSQQYNRANKRVFLAVIIVFAYIAFTLFAAVGTKDADITRISIQLVAAIAVIVIAVIAFITKRDKSFLFILKLLFKQKGLKKSFLF